MELLKKRDGEITYNTRNKGRSVESKNETR